MKTLFQIFIVVGLAYYIADHQPWGPASLGNFYATMVLVSVFYAIRTKCITYAAMMFFMVCGYAIDEMTDWQHPQVVINANILLGIILYQWCNIKGSKNNKYIGTILIIKAFWGGIYVYSGIIPIGIYAIMLNFLSIIEWVWFANMSIDQRNYLINDQQKNIGIFYAKTAHQWLPRRKH